MPGTHRAHTPITSQAQQGKFGSELQRRREGKKPQMRGITTKELESHLHESAGKKLPMYARADGGSVLPPWMHKLSDTLQHNLNKQKQAPQTPAKPPATRPPQEGERPGTLEQEREKAFQSRCKGGPVSPSLTKAQRKSTKGSPEFTQAELMRGYRRLP